MKKDLPIQEGIVIPAHEIEVTTSRSGGHGGQHVNKTSTRITLHWNLQTTRALPPELKERAVAHLQSQLTHEGALVIHCSQTRSQHQNLEIALEHLKQILIKALEVPKERVPTHVPQHVKEARIEEKKRRSKLKKSRHDH